MSASEAEGHLQKELQGDERILWAGKPAVWPLFGAMDLVWVPLGFLWLWFGLGPIIEGFRRGFEFGFSFWGFSVFFFLGGLYVLTARFILKALARTRTYYGVTNKRVLVLRAFPRRSLGTIYLDSVGTVTKEQGRRGRGTISFGNNPMGRTAEDAEFLFPSFGSAVPALVNIADVDSVYALIDTLRQEGRRDAPRR